MKARTGSGLWVARYLTAMCLAHLTFHHPVPGSLLPKPVPDGDSAISEAAPHLMGMFQSCCHLDMIGGREPLRVEKGNLNRVTLQCQSLDQDMGGDRQRGSECRPGAREGAPSGQKGRPRVGGRRRGASVARTLFMVQFAFSLVYSPDLHNSQIKFIKPKTVLVTHNSNHFKE